MKIKPNPDVIAAQKLAANIHHGGSYQVEKDKPILQKKKAATPKSATKQEK